MYNKTRAEILIQLLIAQCNLDLKYYDKIINNNKNILKQYCGKHFDIEQSFSGFFGEDIKKWIKEMDRKHGQEATEGFINFYLMYNIYIPKIENESLNWDDKNSFEEFLNFYIMTKK